jgi:hypothetical protein
VPEQYDWGLWFANGRYLLPHSYVYRRDMSLQAGTTYHFLTRNLQPVTSANPDPVMYLVRGNEIVAFNDDYTGLASEIIYTPTVADSYRLVIRAYATATPGFCDVYQGVGGAAPSLLDSNVMFGGTYVSVRWKLDEWFETGLGTLYFDANVFGGGRPAADPYLFLIYPKSEVGSKMYWNDDGAGFPDSKIVPPSGGTGTVILGSYSRYTGGECRLALVGQSYKAPWMSPAPWASVTKQVPRTPTVTKYMEELERQKPTLDKLSPDERDQRVLELQRRMLPEEEIRQQRPRMSSVSTELVRRQEIFFERCTQMERDLVQMSYDERAAQLAQVKREAMGREYSEPEGPLLPEDDEGDAGRGEGQ